MNDINLKRTLLVVFCVAFFESLSIGIIIPILPYVFLESSYFAHLDVVLRNVLFGFLISVYPLTQFFSSPILGAISDKIGRKPIFVLSLLGTALCHLLFGIGVELSLVWLLFLSKFVDGFTGGNVSVARSAISDVSSKKDKVKNFGVMGMAFGLGFIFGPVLGGLLSDSTLNPNFNYTTPFFAASVIILLDALFVFLMFKETNPEITGKLSKSEIRKDIRTEFSFFKSIKNIFHAFKIVDLRIVFLTLFMASFGWAFFGQFFQVFLIDKFSFSPREISYFFAFLGVSMAITQSVILRFLSSKFKPKYLLTFSLFAIPVVLILHLVVSEVNFLYVLTFFLAVSVGLLNPNFSAIISDKATRKNQGRIMGIQQSIMSLAQALPPLVGGYLLNFGSSVPTMIGAFVVFLSAVLFLTKYLLNTKLFSIDDLSTSSPALDMDEK